MERKSDCCECSLVASDLDLCSPRQQQVKRAFKQKCIESTLAGHRNLHLEDGPVRKKSEVQMYMILHYDRIRETIAKRWEEDRVASLEAKEVDLPNGLFDSRDSFSVKDQKIPINYKTSIARQLYEEEPEAVKVEVRAQREAWHPSGRSVRTDDDEERLELVREYHKCVHIWL